MTLSGKSYPNSDARLAILLLAAGEGSRLGAVPKALLKKEGQTLLRRFCNSVQTLHPVQVVVITGFHAQAIECELESIELTQSLANLPIKVVRNLQPMLGQSSSVRLGLESLDSNYDCLLIALCDQPNVGSKEIGELLNQFKQCEEVQEIVLPMVDGLRGNPVLFSKRVIDQILAIPGMVCRPYMDQHPELVRAYKTENQAYILDVDTNDDIQKLGLDGI